MLLAIDTATQTASIALYNEDALHTEHMWRTGANHTVQLMPSIVEACRRQELEPADLGAVGVSLGPGSFTGLRVGLSLAKGLALALRIPIIGVPTLDAIAYAHARESVPLCAVLPAGRGRWCVGWYEFREGEWQRRGDATLLNSVELIRALQEPALVCGEIDPPLAARVREAAPPGVAVVDPASAARRAGYLAELAWQRYARGEQDDLASLAPMYVEHTRTRASDR
jgi:tRNA threonylcarbamoyladenosine biosynthesis protein TsaB